PGSCCHVSGSCAGAFLSNVSVMTQRQDVGFKKRRGASLQTGVKNATHILSCFHRRCLAPGVIAGAGLANKLLEIKRLDKPEAIYLSLAKGKRGGVTRRKKVNRR